MNDARPRERPAQALPRTCASCRWWAHATGSPSGACMSRARTELLMGVHTPQDGVEWAVANLVGADAPACARWTPRRWGR